MRGVVVGLVCARGRIGFVTVGRAGVRPQALRCLFSFLVKEGCLGAWRARPLLSFVSCGAGELLPAAPRALYCFPHESF